MDSRGDLVVLLGGLLGEAFFDPELLDHFPCLDNCHLPLDHCPPLEVAHCNAPNFALIFFLFLYRSLNLGVTSFPFLFAKTLPISKISSHMINNKL
jgi:hypothetical protein